MDKPISLFERPPEEIEYAHVHEFLQQHLRENERIEYKAKMEDRTIVDTLISMSNGSEVGLIFVGVSEKRGHNIPDEWPLLDAEKNHEGTVYNYCHASSNPTVRPDVLKLPDPNGERAVVLIRVRPGLHKPYASRDKGVLVRVGDQDRPADPATLEQFFRRRYEDNPQRDRFSDLLSQCEAEAQGTPPHYYLVTVPEALSAPLALSDTFERGINALLAQTHLIYLWHGRFREADALGFGIGEHTLLKLHQDGAVYFRDAVEESPGLSGSISIRTMGSQLLRILRFLRDLYPSILEYSDIVLLGVAAGRLFDRSMEWPPSGRLAVDTPRQIEQVRAYAWKDDTLRLTPESNPVEVARDILKKLAWQMKYENYEERLNLWGSRGATD